MTQAEEIMKALSFCEMVEEIGMPDETVIPVWPIETEMALTHPLTVGMVKAMGAALCQTAQGDVEPTAYWAKFGDGSGKIYTDRERAENFASNATFKCEVIPLYAQTPAPQPDTGAEIEALADFEFLMKELAEQYECCDLPDGFNIDARVNNVRTALTARKVDAQSVDAMTVKELHEWIFNWSQNEGKIPLESDISDLIWTIQKRLAAAGHLKAQTWQPIETAPKDGEFDALVIDVFGNIFQGLKGLNGRWSAEDPRGGGDYYINTGKLTHWMPLPPAPAADDREA